MDGIPTHIHVLEAMITPAVLISASGTLVLSTSNRIARVVDRIRGLGAEAERLTSIPSGTLAHDIPARRAFISNQLAHLSHRLVLLRSALTTLYNAIGLLVTTSILVGVWTLLESKYGWVPVVSGLAGGCALLWGSVLLVREGRRAVRSTFEEVAYAREAMNAANSTASSTNPAK
jgi:hypothetical protein